MKPIRWAIFGTGAVAAEFARGLQALDDAEIYAVASRSQERGEAFARRFGVAKVHASYEACAEDPFVDIIYVATPNHRHHDDVVLCLQNAKPVLCEKPFALNAEEARGMVALARSSSVFCMEGMWMRFVPLVRELREKLRSGLLGRPILLSADFGLPTHFDTGNRFFSRELGGGALLDRGVYLVSLAFWLFGRPDAVQSAATPTSTGVDESASVILTYREGPMAVLNTSLTARYSNTATLYGERGRLTLKDPFYAPEEMTVALHAGPRPPADAAGAGGPGAKARMVGMIKRLPLATVAARRFRALRSARTLVRSHGASAYRYEAAEAMRCLRLNLTESPDMPLDETVQILECLDAIRNGWSFPEAPPLRKPASD